MCVRVCFLLPVCISFTEYTTNHDKPRVKTSIALIRQGTRYVWHELCPISPSVEVHRSMAITDSCFCRYCPLLILDDSSRAWFKHAL